MTTIQIRTQFEGVHYYPDAPEEVIYLRQPHRHMFGVCVEVEVFSVDREIEFVMLKHVLDGYIDEKFETKSGCKYMGTCSCEEIAKKFYQYLCSVVAKPDRRYWKVTVSEDGENGASVEYRCSYDEVKQVPSMKEVAKSFGVGERSYGVLPPLKTLDQNSGLSLAEYQEKAYQNIQDHYNRKEEVMHWAVGLGEEAGEVLSVVKHRYYAGRYVDDDDMLEDIINELGDVLWHISSLCSSLGLDLEDVAKYNVAKLADRYPNGKFEVDRSANRHELYKMWKKEDDYHEIMEQIKENKKKKREREVNEGF